MTAHTAALARPLEQPWWTRRSIVHRPARPSLGRLVHRTLVRYRTLVVNGLELAALTGVFALALGSLMVLGKIAS